MVQLLFLIGLHQWNDAFPGDALVIRRGPHNYGRGSLGYYKNGEQGRHILQQGLGNEDFQILWSMAHELGHVFGLLHEHSRPDRDNYVQFNCINLAGFEEALKRAYADGYNKQDLCTREDVADRYGFPSLEYMPDPQGWRSAEYDHDSIMHYPSQAHANVDLVIDPNNPDFYPLVRLSGAERKKKMNFPPEEDFEISAGDVGAIRDMYPW
ncbi:hypothetical protein BKA63DRAFT_568004 [Paraphoma chrysanthemicola]|nr:hypothetical protein BKA63DRAFT_568004 [Paraphoma chrysanthemicola]